MIQPENDHPYHFAASDPPRRHSSGKSFVAGAALGLFGGLVATVAVMRHADLAGPLRVTRLWGEAVCHVEACGPGYVLTNYDGFCQSDTCNPEDDQSNCCVRAATCDTLDCGGRNHTVKLSSEMHAFYSYAQVLDARHVHCDTPKHDHHECSLTHFYDSENCCVQLPPLLLYECQNRACPVGYVLTHAANWDLQYTGGAYCNAPDCGAPGDQGRCCQRADTCANMESHCAAQDVNQNWHTRRDASQVYCDEPKDSHEHCGQQQSDYNLCCRLRHECQDSACGPGYVLTHSANWDLQSNGAYCDEADCSGPHDQDSCCQRADTCASMEHHCAAQDQDWHTRRNASQVYCDKPKGNHEHCGQQQSDYNLCCSGMSAKTVPVAPDMS